MYIFSQILVYLILALLLGVLIAWLVGLCNCNNSKLVEELDAARAERDELAARLAQKPNGENERDEARLAMLEKELEQAKAKLSDSDNNIASGLAGAAIGAGLKTGQVAIDKDELDTLNSRNKYLEARIKFFEEANEKPKAKIEEEISNKNFVVSSAGSMSSEELEAEIVKAGDGTKPKAIARSIDADDLLLIDGVGPKNNAWLNENGIHFFWQIATMTPAELAWLANNLPNFGSRVYRENWVSQCANLAKGLPPR